MFQAFLEAKKLPQAHFTFLSSERFIKFSIIIESETQKVKSHYAIYKRYRTEGNESLFLLTSIKFQFKSRCTTQLTHTIIKKDYFAPVVVINVRNFHISDFQES